MQKITQMQPNEQLVHISGEFIDVTSVDENNVCSNKKIAHDDFLSILSSSMRYTSINSSAMNGFHLGSNIVKFRASEEGFVYYFLVRKGKYNFNNAGKRTMINYPNLIFKLGINKDFELKESGVFVIKDEELKTIKSFGVDSLMIDSKAKLYQYPLGNVGVTGNVCWGGNIFPPLESYINVHEVVNMFFEAPTNTDFTNGIFRDPETRMAILKQLETEPFNEELLVPSNKTFSEI
jgi:hypothetical protein